MGVSFRKALGLMIYFLCLHVVTAATVDPMSRKEVILGGYYPAYPKVNLSNDPAKNALITRGEYLAKMGDCLACHTNVKERTGAFAGGLPIATPFGTFYSPNITPDKETGIGQWTEQDFIRALKEGRDPHGQNYFPVFPYVYFSKISTEDLRAMYAYFMSIPAIKQKNKPQPFPFNVPGARLTLWGWKLLFFFPEDQEIIYNPDESSAWNRGKYIVDGLGHCSMCHTPLNPLGSPKQKYYLTGAFVDGFWAPNITKYGLHSATHTEVADVFSSGQLINHAGPVAGPMADVNHNSLQYLTDEDRLAIATYLKTVVSQETLGVSPSDAAPTLRRGKEVYLKACDVCHQSGEMSAPRLGDAANWYRRLQNSGLTGLYQRTFHGYNSMPVKGACVTCSENDLISAVNYILSASLTRSQWRDVERSGAEKYPANGKTIYDENCAACHNTGAEGAPKLGDKAQWNNLLKKNVDVLVKNAIEGPHHPKNAGCETCTTGEVMEAVKYIISQSKTEGNYSLW